jgi:hypothetical protein
MTVFLKAGGLSRAGIPLKDARLGRARLRVLAGPLKMTRVAVLTRAKPATHKEL